MRCLFSTKRRHLVAALFSAGILGALPAFGQANAPIRVGLSAEFGMQGSHAAQSIEKGMLLAIDEINAAGGVLGRPLALEKRDDRGVPARGVDNLTELAGLPDLVAVFCGRFSPVAIEQAPVANRLGVLLLDPWAAADGIVQQPAPNYVFRLSTTDSWAMETLLSHARSRKFDKLALMLPNTAWGRSSEAAALAFAKRSGGFRLTSYWYNWGDTDFAQRVSQVRNEGAQALIMVANESEGALIVKAMAALPPEQRLPIISHWGIAGGDFAAATGDALKAVDLVVVQTFGFSGNGGSKAKQVAAAVTRRFGHDVAALRGQVGFAHAYDLIHLLAIAVRKAGSTQRSAIRDALEAIDSHDGLVRHYRKPYGANDHEALERSQLFLARFDPDGNLRTINKR
jgi:branched-chain amino acid transport system substrate-binding protein